MKTLSRIEHDCGWYNCAVGTKLKELGVILPRHNSFHFIKRLINPEFLDEGSIFNSNLQLGKKKECLNFIKKLQTTGINEFLK